MPLPLSRNRPVRGLKREEGVDLWVCGGGVLAGALLPQIEGLVLKRHLVVFGSGIPLVGPCPLPAARVRFDRNPLPSPGVW